MQVFKEFSKRENRGEILEKRKKVFDFTGLFLYNSQCTKYG